MNGMPSLDLYPSNSSSRCVLAAYCSSVDCFLCRLHSEGLSCIEIFLSIIRKQRLHAPGCLHGPIMCYYNTYKNYIAHIRSKVRFYGSKASVLPTQYGRSYCQMTMANKNDTEHQYAYLINYINVKYNVSYLSKSK